MSVIPYVENPTWADGSGGGTPIDAADLNKIEQGITDAHLQPAVAVYHNANQAITTATFTTLAFNSERVDQVGGVASAMHDNATNNSRLTCLYAGVYEIKANVEWATSTAGTRILQIRLNATTTIAVVRQTAAEDFPTQFVSRHYDLAVNDYVEARVYQNSGGNLNVNAAGDYSPEFSMVRVA